MMSSPTVAQPRRPSLLRLATVAAVVALSGVVAVAHPAAAATNPTVVSLTFDDGSKDHYDNARPLLRSHNMHGTFFINSGRVNATNFMTKAQITTLANEGDEIGGHTVDHADLPTMPADDQRREICNDRVALLGMGFSIKNLAYPYGDQDSTTRQIAADCGYNSARVVGGIVSGSGCSGCPYAEPIPTAHPYETATPASIKIDTTLTTLKEYVTQAEQHGGGWVQLVIHHVCDGCGDEYSVKPSTLDSFLTWLAPRALTGTTVKTINQVIGGSLKPGVPGPALPPPPAGNMVTNPSLESASSTGVPTCFQLGGYGTNTAAWTRSSDAHTGSYSEQVTISSFTGGDRKLVTVQDSGACVPAATPGHKYQARVWYKGSWGPSAEVRLTMYYRNSSGAWVYWTSAPTLSAVSTWTQTPLYTTPAVPAGATGLSYGLALAGIGSLMTDDYTLSDTATP
jgi:peptidoglycan/xylan/chitin deacetylase (PgdA/CDA1 family)